MTWWPKPRTKATRWWQCNGGCSSNAEDTHICCKWPCGAQWVHFFHRDFISIPYMKDNSKHAIGCSDIFSMNKECSRCWERLWRSPDWNIAVRLRLSTEAQDERAGSRDRNCRRSWTSLRYAGMTATGLLSHNERLLDRLDLAHSWANRLIHRSLVSCLHHYPGSQVRERG